MPSFSTTSKAAEAPLVAAAGAQHCFEFDSAKAATQAAGLVVVAVSCSLVWLALSHQRARPVRHLELLQEWLLNDSYMGVGIVV